MLFRKFTRQIPLILLVSALVLVGCNVGAAPAPTIDVNAVNTSIVGTTVAQLSAQFTQTALAVPSPTSAPTNTRVPLPTFALPTQGGASPTAGTPPTVSFNTTPLPGFTPLASASPAAGATAAAGTLCDSNVFEGDITVPDGTVFKPGVNFQKIWAIRNTGTCTWDDGYKLIFYAGDKAIDPYDFIFKKSSDFVSPGEGINIAMNLTAPLAVGKYQGHWKMQNDQGQWFGTFLSVYIEVKK